MAIHFAEPVAPEAFAGLAGVGEVTVDDGAPGCGSRSPGPLDAVVKAAAAHRVVDLLSEPADLDEIFLGFYRGDA